MTPPESTNHSGRFAPSPTGDLHFGSLLAALASFLQTRHHGGAWHVRMEDLDAPRHNPAAADNILRTLERFGLRWDGPVVYQSARGEAYAAALQALTAAGQTFPCACTRRQALTGPMGLEGRIYAGHCRAGLPAGSSPRTIRLRVSDEPIVLHDLVQGRYSQRLARDVGDFVLKRAYGAFAYQLAVVVDDAFSRIGDVVRGADLLSSTPRQIYLQQLLGLPRPRYLHVPVLMDGQGRKLSKSAQAPVLANDRPGRTLVQALRCLGQLPPPEAAEAGSEDILEWAYVHWQAGAIPARTQMPLKVSVLHGECS
jgi:glutamyl-Q tRNA(Asp) synthetase